MIFLKRGESPPDKQLLLREWATIAIVAVLILICGAVSWAVRLRAKANIAGWDRVAEAQKAIEVELAGAVLRPGSYPFSPGVTLKEVLQAAGIAKQADRKKINFKKVIYSSGRIEIPSKPKKTKRKQAA